MPRRLSRLAQGVRVFAGDDGPTVIGLHRRRHRIRVTLGDRPHRVSQTRIELIRLLPASQGVLGDLARLIVTDQPTDADRTIRVLLAPGPRLGLRLGLRAVGIERIFDLTGCSGCELPACRCARWVTVRIHELILFSATNCGLSGST